MAGTSPAMTPVCDSLLMMPAQNGFFIAY